jgi:hypothetical protein
MKTLRRSLVLLPLALLLAGCATPERRIQQNQALFDSFPVAAQARIRGGQIDLGFTTEMVRIALGEPQRKLLRRTPGGEGEVWLYLDTTQRYSRQRADIDGINVTSASGRTYTGGSAWVNMLQENEYVRTRVEFLSGMVAAIEELAPDKK